MAPQSTKQPNVFHYKRNSDQHNLPGTNPYIHFEKLRICSSDEEMDLKTETDSTNFDHPPTHVQPRAYHTVQAFQQRNPITYTQNTSYLPTQQQQQQSLNQNTLSFNQQQP